MEECESCKLGGNENYTKERKENYTLKKIYNAKRNIEMILPLSNTDKLLEELSDYSKCNSYTFFKCERREIGYLSPEEEYILSKMNKANNENDICVDVIENLEKAAEDFKRMKKSLKNVELIFRMILYLEEYETEEGV